LLYGERLPEVMKTWGKHFIELKKSVQGIRDQFDEVARGVTSTIDSLPQRQEPVAEREEATAPKFEPPQSEPAADRTEG
jgi:Sec-independent protein translocase protein TatA